LDVLTVPYSDVTDRVAKYRADAAVMKETERQTAELLAQPNVTLIVDRKFVVNTFLAARAFKEVMAAAGATSIGPGDCMGGLIGRLDTPPCLVLSLLNDEGYTAYCHCDYTHTPAGILLHHISGKPTFLSNSHYPHHGMITLAHCSAPRKMNGKDDEPVKILTHFESDYGAATKVEYTKGQVTTHLVPNLVCTKWLGFRGRILDSPSYDACRSQMDVVIDGDWHRLLRDLQGFHTQTVYGDYLREIGYALKKVGMGWENVSET
jgi:L-fucose isomerase-like protein